MTARFPELADKIAKAHIRKGSYQRKYEWNYYVYMSVIHKETYKRNCSYKESCQFCLKGFENAEIDNRDKQQRVYKPGHVDNGGIRTKVVGVPV